MHQVSMLHTTSNEFLLGKAKEAFDDKGNIINEGTVKFFRPSCLETLSSMSVLYLN